MKKNRKKKILGYFLILLGIAIPLYGFTGLTKSIIEDKRGYEKFISQALDEDTKKEEEKKIENYNNKLANDTGIVDPFSTDEFKTDYKISQDPHAVFAYLSIPAIDLIQPIRLDASNKHMADGLAHVDGTSLPVGGKNRRSVIAGHRGYYQSIMFLNLDELKAGDLVYIDRENTRLEYKVINKEIINPSEWEKLNPIENRDMLTLLTCDPLLPPRPHRLLVNCERIVEEESRPQKEQEPKENKMVKNVKMGIISITLLGWIAFFIVAIRFVVFLRKSK